MPNKNQKSNIIHHLEFYQILVDSVQDYAIFMLDIHGNIASWNLGAQKLKGYTPDEIIGKHFSIFFTDEDNARQKPKYELEQCDLHGRTEDEYWRVRKDGTVFWANVVITALHDDEGRPIGYAKVTRDLTARKRHEDMLKKANENLQRQQVELEALNSAKDEFIAIASHQLRTPATGVKQFLGLLKEGYVGDLSDQQYQFITKAYDANDRQIALVNSLLRVAQVDAGKVNLKIERTDISAMITGIVEEMSGTIKDRQQRIEVHTPDRDLYVSVDPVRFRMVLENLIDNASKYTLANGQITVTAKATAADYRIEVSDNGVGIDEPSLGKLFTKFSRIPNMMSDSSTGSGLGLYWVKKVVELHGGRVSVISKEGVGSTFTIIIPKEGIK